MRCMGRFMRFEINGMKAMGSEKCRRPRETRSRGKDKPERGSSHKTVPGNRRRRRACPGSPYLQEAESRFTKLPNRSPKEAAGMI